jgi:hypothetical protein
MHHALCARTIVPRRRGLREAEDLRPGRLFGHRQCGHRFISVLRIRSNFFASAVTAHAEAMATAQCATRCAGQTRGDVPGGEALQFC